MLVVQARESCAHCGQPSAARRDATPVCVSHALAPVGAAYETSTASNLVVHALAGPPETRPDTLRAARAELRSQMDDVVAYNAWAAALVAAVRQLSHAHGVSSHFMTRTVNAPELAAGALAMKREGRPAATDAAALFYPLAQALGSEYHARTLIAEAVGPVGVKDEWWVPRLLHIGADAAPPTTWRDLAAHVELPADAGYAPTGAMLLREALTPVGDEADTSANIVASAHLALRSSLMGDMGRRLRERAEMLRTWLRQQWPDACAEPAALNPGATAALLAMLSLDECSTATAGEMVRGAAATASLPLTTVVGSLRGLLEAFLRADKVEQCRALIDASASSSLALQHVDASLLQRAKESVLRAATGRRYEVGRMTEQLLRLFSRAMQTSTAFDVNFAWFAGEVAAELRGQRIITEAASGSRAWPEFLMVAGNEFYRAPAPPSGATAPRATVTQAAFVQTHRDAPDPRDFALQLVNMAAYMARNALRASALTPGDGELLTPGGVGRVAPSPERTAVAGDLQRIRRDVAAALRPVASTRTTDLRSLSQPLAEPLKMVDSLLLTIFDKAWESTMPAQYEEGDKYAQWTFSTIYADYMRASGSPQERRSKLLAMFRRRR